MFYEKIKNKRGITLIALVVTIVVLLILAGVTISMLTGENGIINQAKNAKEESLKSELEELVDLTLMEYKTDKESGKNTDLGKLLDSKKGKDFENVTEDDDGYIVEKNGYEVKVSKDGERLNDAEKVGGIRPDLKMEKSYNEGTDIVTITVTINNFDDLGRIDSFKLYDFENKEIAEKTNEEDRIKKFEVEENGKYKSVVSATTDEITSTGNKSIVVDEFEIFSDIYTSTKQYTDSEGNTAWIPKGFAVGVSDNINKISTGLVITDEINEGYNSTGNEFVWIPASEQTYQRTDFGINIGWTGNDIPFTDFIENVNTIELNSIKSYNGYYIGRYEAGDKTSTMNKTYRVKGSKQTNEVSIKKGQAPYNYISQTNAKKLSEELAITQQYEGVTTRLISSFAWDTAINFIQIKNENYGTLPSTYGNYKNNTFLYKNLNGTINEKLKGTSVLVPTGRTTAVNNIYDMAGNINEWTTETYKSYICARGAAYSNESNFAAGFRGYDPASCDYHDYTGFRITMFLS